MKTGKWKKALGCAAFLLVLVLTVQLAAAVLRPEHTIYGSTWDVFLCEPKDSVDVMFMGGSAAYCGWNPGVVYDESGLVSYVMAGSQQPANVTYWYLKEVLKTQSPKVVVMEGKSLLYDRYTNYIELNLCYMPWGIERVMATLEGAPREEWLDLFFDLNINHGRWKQVRPADLERVLTAPQVREDKGHTSFTQVIPAGTQPEVLELPISQEQYQANLQDVKRIADLCEAEGIDLIVTINPTYRQFTDEVWAQIEADLGTLCPTLTFLNWSEAFDEMGLDPAIHLYDLGHLNEPGAQIFSRYTARYLLSLGYTPRQQTQANTAAWQETAQYWTK